MHINIEIGGSNTLVSFTLLFTVCGKIVCNDFHCQIVDLFVGMLLKLLYLVQPYKGEGGRMLVCARADRVH